MTPEEEAKKKQLFEEMNQILFRDYKQFPDSARLFFAKEFFALRINVGNQGFTYALTPFLAKKLSERFAELIDLYERTERPIPTAVESLSPFQQEDFQKPEEPDGENGDSDKPKPGDKPKEGK